ncbi:MAG: MFS transporter [Spirochaetia bacterium]|nr:MFS transporter [Spirochaetia bacterium]
MKFIKIRYIVSLFLFYAMYAIVAPYFQIFLHGKGLTPSITGIIIGIWEVSGIAGPLFLGALVDRTGSFRIVLLICTLVSSTILYAIISSQSLVVIFFLAALFGFVFKPIMSVNDSMISHNLPDPEHDYGHVRGAGSIGFVVVLIFFEMTGIFDSPTPAAIARGTLILGALYAVSIVFIPPAAHSNESRRITSRWVSLNTAESRIVTTQYIILITAVFLGRFGFSSYYSFFSIYLQEEMHVVNVGLYWMIAVSAEVFPILFAGKIIQGTGRFIAILLGLGAMVTRLMIYSFTDSLIILGFAQLLHGLTFGLLHAACISFINAKINPENKTIAMSLYLSIAWGLAAFLGSPLGGLLIENMGFQNMFRIMAIFPLSGILLIIGYKFFLRGKGHKAF